MLKELYNIENYRPKKLLHASQDDTYKPGNHELYEVQKQAEKTCRYDLDDLDVIWLTNFNQIQELTGTITAIELELYAVYYRKPCIS